MKRDDGCKGCSWNFGRTPWPCVYCEGHDLFTDFPYHPSEDMDLQKMLIGMISATIYFLIYHALTEGPEEKEHASLQQETNQTDEL
jgi:hypothetical protein